MSSVDQALIDEACASLNVALVGDLKDGGQKVVRLVERAGDLFVLKVIQVGATTPQALLRAAREVALLESLNSAHVVRVASDLLELGGPPPAGAAWLEEHLDGDDLADLVAGRWTWDEAASMAVELGRGLGVMHQLHVVHRDLSPNNVRRTSAGVFKIMDPGFARYELLPSLTVGGHPGTYGFMSPEHLAALPAGPTTFSDVFCVGSLMWLVLTGTSAVPYLGDLADYIDRLRRVELHDAPGLQAALGPDRYAVLARCLHPQPARRYRNGDELADELEGLL